MKIDVKQLRELARVGGGTASPYSPVLGSELNVLLDVYEAAMRWREYKPSCREDRLDRDAALADELDEALA